jgi:phage gp45-like
MSATENFNFIMKLGVKIKLLFAKARLISVNNLGQKGNKPTGTNPEPQRIYASGLANEFFSQVERTQEYGLETYPEKDAIPFIAFLGGRRDAGVAISIQDPRYRPTDLTEGNVCLYDKDTARVSLKSGKVAAGNKTLNIELLDLFDQVLTLLQGNVDAVGAASTGTNSLINAQLAVIQGKLGQIKGTL